MVERGATDLQEFFLLTARATGVNCAPLTYLACNNTKRTSEFRETQDTRTLKVSSLLNVVVLCTTVVLTLHQGKLHIGEVPCSLRIYDLLL